MIRVLLVHDERLLRSALAERLAREGDLDVFHTPWGTAPSRARTLCPDVCVADLNCSDPYGMPPLWELPIRPVDGGHRNGDGDGHENRTWTKKGGRHLPACRLLVLATANKPGPLRRAVKAHALGYVNKESSPERLLVGIRTVAQGERFVDDSLGFAFLSAVQIPLTRRELSVLSLAAGGASVAEIADSLHLSNGTVRNYMAAITRKTGARNRIDAIRICLGEGWL